jgi:hypothetical protein
VSYGKVRRTKIVRALSYPQAAISVTGMPDGRLGIEFYESADRAALLGTVMVSVRFR